MRFFRCIWVAIPLELIELFYSGVPLVRTDGQLLGRCTVTWLQNFLGWVDLLSYEAPDACATHARGVPLIYTKKLLNSPWLRKECSSPVIRVQIIKWFPIGWKNKRNQREPIRLELFQQQNVRKWRRGFQQKMIWFCMQKIGHFKNIPTPEHSKKYVFVAKCIENVKNRKIL